MNKENAAACTNQQIMLMETENLTTHNTADETISASSQSTSPEEDCKAQTLKEEEKLMKEQQQANKDERRGDGKMEVEPCPATAVSSHEKGKC